MPHRQGRVKGNFSTSPYKAYLGRLFIVNIPNRSLSFRHISESMLWEFKAEAVLETGGVERAGGGVTG